MFVKMNLTEKGIHVLIQTINTITETPNDLKQFYVM